MPSSLPRWTEQVLVGFFPCPRGLPRVTGGSASTSKLSRPAQASLALRPARLQPAQWRTCSEAPTQPVTRPSRSVATMLTDNYMGGSSSHWRSAPLGRTVYTLLFEPCARGHDFWQQ